MPCVRPPCQSRILRGSTASHVSNVERRDIEPADHAEELEHERVLVEISVSTAEAVGEDSVAAAPVVLVKVSHWPLVCDRDEGDLIQR
jgi:hypothetical protein